MRSCEEEPLSISGEAVGLLLAATTLWALLLVGVCPLLDFLWWRFCCCFQGGRLVKCSVRLFNCKVRLVNCKKRLINCKRRLFNW